MCTIDPAKLNMAAIFTQEMWGGGFYELALEYGHSSKASLAEALQALWTRPDLQGCYLHADEDPSRQPRVAPDLGVLESGEHLRGVATLPNGIQVACGTYLVREQAGEAWIGLYLPMGALATAYNVGGFPFDQSDSSQDWRQPLEEWLAQIGQGVYLKSPFLAGLVGFEVSGAVSAEELSISGVPAKRCLGYLFPSAYKLTWYPTNQWLPSHLLAS
jgi:hypothetical protein